MFYRAPLEVAATVALTMMLREGSFPGVNHTFQKVVHVGHSFGSAQTYLLANMYPNITDGIVLTGFTMNASFTNLFLAGANLQQANVNQPLRFSNVTGSQVQDVLALYAPTLADYISPVDFPAIPPPQNLSNGYLISSNAEANKYLFFYPNNYDPAILTFAESAKQPVTVGELLSLGSAPMTNKYTGPVIVVDGGAFL